MSTWKRQALEAFPEFRSKIEPAPSPMAMWVELWFEFEAPFRSGNDNLVRRFFQYAAWCMDTAVSGPTDTSTAAWCSFYEHLPTVPGLVERLHEFLPHSRFVQVQQSFAYLGSEKDYAQFCATYLASIKGAKRGA